MHGVPSLGRRFLLVFLVGCSGWVRSGRPALDKATRSLAPRHSTSSPEPAQTASPRSAYSRQAVDIPADIGSHRGMGSEVGSGVEMAAEGVFGWLEVLCA